MTKSFLSSLAILWVLGMSLQAAESIQARAIHGSLNGPEGLIAGPQGELYVAEEGGKGILWRWRGKRMEPFCDVSRLGHGSGDLLGLAIEKEHLYVAAPALQGGSVIRVPLLHPSDAVVFASNLGFTNGLISDGHHLFVSDTSPASSHGHIIRISLDGNANDPTSTFQTPIPRPNGLALSPDHQTLFVVHSSWLWSPSYIAAYDARTLHLLRKAKLNGQGDGLAWHDGFLYACLQHEGRIVVIDPAHLDNQNIIQLPQGSEGQIRPASNAFLRSCRHNTRFAVTDVADASAFDYVLRTLFKRGLPWHHSVYLINIRSK